MSPARDPYATTPLRDPETVSARPRLRESLAVGASALVAATAVFFFGVVLERTIAYMNTDAPSPIRATTSEEPRAPEAPTVVRVSEAAFLSRVVRRVEPEYPADARGVEGTVVVEVVVGEDGKVVEARAVSGLAALHEVCVTAARQWIFTPAIVSGTPAKVIGTIFFEIRRPEPAQASERKPQPRPRPKRSACKG